MRDFKLDLRGRTLDLAIASDELIGVVIRAARDPVDDLAYDLALFRRYFDRVLAVVDACHLPAARHCNKAGATLWAVDDGGRMSEHVAGTKNEVAPAALFESLAQEQRTRLVRSLIPHGTTYRRSVVRSSFPRTMPDAERLAGLPPRTADRGT